MKGIFYRGTDDVEKIAEENPSYRRVYLNKKETDCDGMHKTTVFLTKDQGETLYIVSEKNYNKIEELFPKELEVDFSMKSPVEKRLIQSKPAEIKKIKQTNILKFFKQSK